MSFLLPQSRSGTVRSVRPLDIHGDRYVDVQLALDDQPDRPVVGRIAASEVPGDLAVGERVEARYMMGVIVKLSRV